MIFYKGSPRCFHINFSEITKLAVYVKLGKDNVFASDENKSKESTLLETYLPSSGCSVRWLPQLNPIKSPEGFTTKPLISVI